VTSRPSKIRWTAEEYQRYLLTGEEPTTEPDPGLPKRGRTEKHVRAGRCHRVTVRRPDVGVTFDSLTEERRYDWLLAQPDVRHVDVHPVVSLPGGIRYRSDFLVYGPREDDTALLGAVPLWLEDVKGSAKLPTEFRRIRKLFDSHHPRAPLRVVIWDSGEKTWKEVPA